jgi:hypothetical protein
MYEPQEQHLDQAIQDDQQGIDLLSAYKAFVRAIYRIEFSNSSSKEKDHA